MSQTLSDAERQLVDRLSCRNFAFKALSVESSALRQILEHSPLPKEWIYVGHLRHLQKRPLANVFFAKLLTNQAVSNTTRWFEFRHAVTFRLPNQKVLASYPDWLPLQTKRWTVFDVTESSDVCVTFFVKRKSGHIAPPDGRDVAL